jgi:hypothetical protein
VRNLVASATTVALLTAGCIGDHPWPNRPVSIATRAFATQGEIATIDILPLDLQMWAQPSYAVELEKVREGAEGSLMGIAAETLAARNYAVASVLDWNGDFIGGHALSPDDLLATVGSLERYGAAVAAHPGELPVPFLPARLGTATGADATLYVGGWAYVAERQNDQLATGVIIALAVVAVVAIIAIIASKSHGGGHGGGGHGGGGHIGAAGGHVGAVFTASRGLAHAHAGRLIRGAADAIDAFGRIARDVALSPDWIEWDADPALPHDGADSQMYLEMTLVDNHTGLALWHSHQRFPASAERPDDVVRAARMMMSLLPPRMTTSASALGRP